LGEGGGGGGLGRRCTGRVSRLVTKEQTEFVDGRGGGVTNLLELTTRKNFTQSLLIIPRFRIQKGGGASGPIKLHGTGKKREQNQNLREATKETLIVEFDRAGAHGLIKGERPCEQEVNKVSDLKNFQGDHSTGAT